MTKRIGFTLIELVVAVAILLVLITMAMSVFGYVGTLARSQQSGQASLQNVSTVLDQMTKELRQCVTQTSSHGAFTGILYPSAAGSSRSISNILGASSPAYGSASDANPYVFDVGKGPIVQFFASGDDGIYRISYTLGLPASGGLAARYWPRAGYQPCQVLYTREKWNDANANWAVDTGELTTIVSSQPITDQVITNLTVSRPSWSGKVVQVVIEATVKDATGAATATTRIAQVTVRQ